MKKTLKILIFLFVAVLLLASVTLFVRENEEVAPATTAWVTKSENNKQKKPLSRERQEKMFDEFIINNEKIMPQSDDFKRNVFYAYYDIGNDGNLDMIEGFLPENSDEIRIRSLYGIVDGQVRSRNFWADPEYETAVPVIYSNGVIRNGGSSGSVCEKFGYYRFTANNFLSFYMVLTCLAPPASVEEEWYVCYRDTYDREVTEKISKKEYDRIKGDAEATPINSELEWRSAADFINNESGF